MNISPGLAAGVDDAGGPSRGEPWPAARYLRPAVSAARPSSSRSLTADDRKIWRSAGGRRRRQIRAD